MNIFKKNRSLVIIFILVFFVSWILGVLRFDYVQALYTANFLLFPFGYLFIIFDTYFWEHVSRSCILNNEFFSLFMFFLSVIGQTLIYYCIYKFILLLRFNHAR
jgi:hypothetical protein